MWMMGTFLLSFLFFILLLSFCFVFPRGRDPRALPAAMVSYVREKMSSSSHWRTGQASRWTTVRTDELHSAAGGRGRLRDALREWARACSTHRCSWYDGTWTFSLYRSLSDLSGCCLHGHQHPHPQPPPSSTAPSHDHDTLQIEFTESHYQYWVVGVCVCVCLLSVSVLGCQCVVKDRRTLKTVSVGHGQHVLLFLPGAMLNFIFKFYSVNLKSFHCSLNKVGVK